MLLVLNVGNTHTGIGVFDDGLNLISCSKRLTHPLPSSENELRDILVSASGTKLSAALRGSMNPELKSGTPECRDEAANEGTFSAVQWTEGYRRCSEDSNPALRGEDSLCSMKIAASSVVPNFTDLLRKLPSALILDNHSSYSFDIRTDRGSVPGTDRLANIEACIQLFGAPCIVVDTGTATTFSVAVKNTAADICLTDSDLPGNGTDAKSSLKERPSAFLGGAITAGLGLSSQALTRNAAQIPSFDLQVPSLVIGRNTKDALLSGTVLGHAFMIDSMIQRIKLELKHKYKVAENPIVVLTGGLSSFLFPLLTEVNHHDPFLTLRGIAYVYDRVRKGESQLCFAEQTNSIGNYWEHRRFQDV